MQTKMIEIRDSGTCIAALAIRMIADGDGMPQAHNWITQHWDEIESGDVVDVQYILNETTAPKTPEIGVSR